jgi:hypothetical protein
MPEYIKIIIGIFVVSFFATGAVYLRPLRASHIFGTTYPMSLKRFFVTQLIIFIILLLGFYFLMGGFTFTGNSKILDWFGKEHHASPQDLLHPSLVSTVVMSFIISFIGVAVMYACLGRTVGFTKQYLITVCLSSVVVVFIIYAIDRGWYNIVQPQVFLGIGIAAFSICILLYFVSRNKRK